MKTELRIIGFKPTTMIYLKKNIIKAVAVFTMFLVLAAQLYPVAYVYADETGSGGESSSSASSDSGSSESNDASSDSGSDSDSASESSSDEGESNNENSEESNNEEAVSETEIDNEAAETLEESSVSTEDGAHEERLNNNESDEVEDIENDEESVEPIEETGENNTSNGSGGSNGTDDEVEESAEANVITDTIDLTEATSTTDIEELQEVQEILEETLEELEEETIITSTTTSTTTGPIIVSGTSVAMANILNIVNTSVVNSTGAIVFANLLDGEGGDIDLRDDTGTTSGRCVIFNCGSDVNLNFLNDAYIKNLINVSAVSGDNSIFNGNNSEIHSGDAYAGVNLINIANTNLINSNYLLVTLNAFQGVRGDIVFPSLENFFKNLSTASIGDIEFHGEAQVNNAISTDAASGENNVSNANQSTISTGDAHSSSNVFNQINSNFIGGGSVSILFRVHGKWVGDIFGAPESLAWTRAEDGSVLLFDTQSGAAGLAGEGTTNAKGTSTLDIDNDVAVVALTGENEIDGANTALISTGNAYAGSNVVNIANSNIIGRNWMLAIVNIFGDFEGNIAFGRPDLWVGEQVIVPGAVRDGSEITYKFTVINNGDAQATNVKLKDNIDNGHVHVLSSSLAYTEDSQGDLEWSIGTIPSGGATEITYTARLVNTGYETDITNTVTVQAKETDNNTQDNTDTATIRTASRPSEKRTEIINVVEEKEEELIEERTFALEDIEVKRENKDIILEYPDLIATQSIIVSNTSSKSIPSVVVHDIMRDEEGNVIQNEVWELGTVLAYEEINIGYDIKFASYAKEGKYTLSTYISSGGTQTATFQDNGSITLKLPEVMPELLPQEEVSLNIDESADSGDDNQGDPVVQKFNSFVSSVFPVAEAEGGMAEGNMAAASWYGFRTYAYIVAIICFGLVLALIFGADMYHYWRKR